jgi:bifunctional DNase/RNase
MKKLPVEVTGITNCAPYQGYVVILKEFNGKRWLPIFIGAPEAHNISLLLQGLRYVRPLTYDLFANLLEAAGTKVASITVTDLRDNTFYAEVAIRLGNGEVREVDARPSDAIALAIKSKTPLYVNAAVLDEAGLIGDVTPQNHDFADRLQDLNRQLKEAVDQEAYEEAAKLRDQIRAIEEQFQAS